MSASLLPARAGPSAASSRPFVASSSAASVPQTLRAAASRPATVQRHRPFLPLRALREQEPDARSSPSPSPAISSASAIALSPSLSPERSLSGSLDAPFLEPLLRNLVLGVAAGGVAELAHVAVVMAHAGAFGPTAASLLPPMNHHMAALLSPMWCADHAVALGVWALLYLVEAATVSRILDDHPDQPEQAARTIRTTRTLPKTLMPLSLNTLKKALLKTFHMNPATPALSSASSSSAFARANSPAAADESQGEATTLAYRAPSSEFEREVARRRSGSLTTSPSIEADVFGRVGSAGLSRAGSITAPERDLQRRPSGPQHDDDDDKGESKREREIRERKGYLKNFWYAAALSQDLKADKPLEVTIMGRKLALFRDENGAPQCIEGLCPHRGARLGQGWVKEVKGHNCVVCPYHAWAFDKNGTLQDVPAATKGCLPKRPMLDGYPVEEKGGFVWVFVGSRTLPADERPPIPCVPELNMKGWRAVYAEMEFEAPHFETFDNALDMAHIHYVHNSSFGNPDKPELRDMAMEKTQWGVTGSFKIHNKPVHPLLEWMRVPFVPVEVKAFLPATSAVRVTLGHGMQMITFVNTIPIDEHRSINRFCLIRNWATSPLFDPLIHREMVNILAEDKSMVESVDSSGMKAEFSLAPDLPQIAFRQLRQEWVRMGNLIPPEATKGPKGSLDV